MSKKMTVTLIVVMIVVIGGFAITYLTVKTVSKQQQTLTNSSMNAQQSPTPTLPVDPLQITQMRQHSYPGSKLTIEQTLSAGINYHQYIASYLSDGLKIYGLLTVPDGTPPASGWPAIIFNHGYIPPEQYKTTERYVAYVGGFARSGYVVFKPDYRGNGNSQGDPEGAYYSPAYAIDVLNALSSVKQYPGVDPNRIGMWGHSMGGNITLRVLVVSKDIKVAVIWGGVVGSYDDLMNNWTRKVPFHPSQRELSLRNNYRQDLIAKYGTPEQNPQFWNSVDPTYYLNDINVPVQLDVGGADEEVPVAFSQSLYDKLNALNKNVQLYIYPGADHNISGTAFNLAMQRSIDFFNQYLKNQPENK